MTRADSLIGTVHPDRHSYAARRLYRGGAPEWIVPVLRQIWRDVFDGDTDRMLQRLLAQDWELLDPGCAGPVAGPDLVAGIGKMDWSGPPDREVGDLRNTRAAVGHAWAYLVDDVDDHLLVFEASVHGRWLWHSRHRLQAAFDGLRSSPVFLPTAGDAATAGHVGHAWRPAVVSLDGLHTAWPAEVCTGEHARGVVVTRFDTDTLDEVIDVLDLFYRDRRPGSGLPVMSRTGRQLTVRWFAGTGHDNYLHVLADVDGRYVLGPQIWPWILSGEEIPGHDPTCLRGGTPPILEWVSPAGFAAAQPDLAGYPLPLVCAALTVLHPGRPAVIAPADRKTGHAIGGATGYVWLPAPSHALMLTPMARLSDPDAVLLPRPLGGSWSTDSLVPVVAAVQVARVCAHIAKGHIRLDAALTGPAADQPHPPTGP
jgi:hypothetical protein